VIQFKQSDTAAILILTLTENVSITDPYYLFVFTHVLTKQQVIFIKSLDDEESDFPNRYNQFTIDPAVIFLGAPNGEYHYEIYEQASSTNTDITLTGAILEYGKLILDRAIPFAFTMYNQSTTYAAYNG
jgi:hypothetical protein